jgi:hypothetical protein
VPARSRRAPGGGDHACCNTQKRFSFFPQDIGQITHICCFWNMQNGLDTFLIRVRPLLRSYYVLRHCDTTHGDHSALNHALLPISFLFLSLAMSTSHCCTTAPLGRPLRAAFLSLQVLFSSHLHSVHWLRHRTESTQITRLVSRYTTSASQS